MTDQFVNAIATIPPPSDRQTFPLPTPPLTDTERHAIAALLAWDCRFHVSVEEILGVEQIGETAWVNLSRNRTMPIAASMLSSIRHPDSSEQYEFISEHSDHSSEHLTASFEHLTADSEHYTSGFDHLTASSDHFGQSSDHLPPSFLDYGPSSTDKGFNSTDNSPNTTDNNPDTPDSDIEIDSNDAPVTPTYRVWQSRQLLGTFHRSPVDNKWLTHPVYGRDYNRHIAPEQAIAAITTAWKHAQLLRNSDKAVTS